MPDGTEGPSLPAGKNSQSYVEGAGAWEVLTWPNLQTLAATEKAVSLHHGEHGAGGR